jgi:DNA-binding NtrC family response regulator
VQHFLNRGARQRSITPDALARLCEYHWPGNVRELENTIERALVLAKNGVITEPEIELRPRETPAPISWTDSVPLEQGWKGSVEALEKSLLERALRQAAGNKAKAAELLGIHRRLLYDKMREYGLETP